MPKKIPDPTKEIHASYARLRVLSYLNEGLWAARIGKLINKDESTVRRAIYVLERHKLVVQDKYSSIKIYKLTSFGFYIMQHLRNRFRSYTPEQAFEFERIYRLHHVMLRFQILKKNPEIIQNIREAGFIAGRYGKIPSFISRIDEFKIYWTGQSLMILPDKIYAKSAMHATEILLDRTMQLKEKLKAMFPFVDFAEKVEICRMHLATVGGPTKFIPEGFNYRSDLLVIDGSEGLPEIETIGPLSVENMLKLIHRVIEPTIRDEPIIVKGI